MSKQRQSIVLILGSAIGLCACATSTQLPEPMAAEDGPTTAVATDERVQITGSRLRHRADQPVMNSFPLVSHGRDELLGTGLARRNLAEALMLINPTIR